jgi:hypothetical protein
MREMKVLGGGSLAIVSSSARRAFVPVSQAFLCERAAGQSLAADVRFDFPP